MTEDGPVRHTDVGAYALGLLEEDDRRAFEAHLAGCPACSAEVADLTRLRELLIAARPAPTTTEPGTTERGAVGSGTAETDSVAGRGTAGAGQAGGTDDVRGSAEVASPADAGGSADVASLLRRRRVAARRRRRGTAILGAAAGLALLAGGATLGAALAGHGDGTITAHGHPNMPADLLGWGETHRAANPRTGASGIVALEVKAWGTHVALDLGGIRGPLTCRLIAVDRSGQRHVVTEWAVPPKGYGVAGSPDHLQVHGGTAVQRRDLDRFDVEVEGGGVLLSIPV
ncbi:anti-sigma factor family protein [Actinoallomurus rhizosphaericola]|uniref:anti-sigma factor family protein n=1 Tax=Actinoallomurus rhizosphaericola TaxID=2952536 RepID=UPI0020935727|nr:zf-HC2 domain-containing protein [Actinoallomurus rhizosphaericola]MCO5998303.1 zf-HC2 domain-containing protein [Actinoallomurus rhizosphaericola]